MAYFKNIKSFKDLKEQFKKLARINHPDAGGDIEIMKAINQEYDNLFPIWKHRYNKTATNKTTETADTTRNKFYSQSGWEGSKHDWNRSTKEVAAIIRSYVKEVYPTYKFSVRYSRASMCSEIHVELKEAPHSLYKTIDELNEEETNNIRKKLVYNHLFNLDQWYDYELKNAILEAWEKSNYYKVYNDLTNAVIEDVDREVKSYNFEDCDGMTDYFHVHFYYFGCKVSDNFKVVEKIARVKGTSKQENTTDAEQIESVENNTNRDIKKDKETQKQEEVEKTTIKSIEQSEKIKEVNLQIERRYFPINEQLAKTSQTLWSFYDYKEDSATESYKVEVEEAYKIVDRIANEKPERLQSALTIAERYSKAYADWINKGYSIEMMCPSVMICGAGNFSVRKKEKQNIARDKHIKDFEYIKGYLNKLEDILYSKEIIKSGDVDAVEKLTEKLKQLEDHHELMKSVNAYYRKNKTLEGCDLINQKTINSINDLMTRIPYHTQPFASYELTNNNASIKSTKQRLEQLQKAKATGTQESKQLTSSVCKVVENTEIMRIQLLFDDIPDASIRNILKSNGFRWSPSNKAWQRQLTDNARYSTKKVIDQIEKLVA